MAEEYRNGFNLNAFVPPDPDETRETQRFLAQSDRATGGIAAASQQPTTARLAVDGSPYTQPPGGSDVLVNALRNLFGGLTKKRDPNTPGLPIGIRG